MDNDKIYKPAYSTDHPDFYLIPGLHTYLINEYGTVIRKRDGSVVGQHLNKYGFSVVNLRTGREAVAPFRVDNLVCRTFYGPPVGDKTEVKHIFDERNNNHFKDLLWCTRSALVEQSDANFIYAWDTIDDPQRLAIKAYRSIREIEKTLPNIDRELISKAIKSNGGQQLYQHRYIFKFKNDPTPWFELTETEPYTPKTVREIRDVYPNSEVEQVKNLQLFLVQYPGLTLAIGKDTLLAFCHRDEWHISTQKTCRDTTCYQYHLRELYRITHWYNTRKELMEYLKNNLPAG